MTATTRLFVWARTATDSRNTASCVHTYTVLRGSAVAMARRIDTFGPTEVERLISKGELAAEPSNQMYGGEGSRVATNHGVTVKYASGRVRTVRGW